MEVSSPAISTKHIIKGLKFFIGLTLTGFVFLLYRSPLSESISHLKDFNLTYFGLVIILVTVEWVLGSSRIFLFAKAIQPEVSFVSCFKANMANIFLGGLTPSQTGGGAGQIYILHKSGMKVINATVASFLSFLSSVIFLLSSALMVTLFWTPEINNALLQILSNTTYTLFFLILSFVIISIKNPEYFQNTMHFILRFMPRLKLKLQDNGHIDQAMKFVRDYHELMLHFVKHGKLRIIAGVFLAGANYFTKFVIAFLIVRGMGIETDFLTVIYIQFLLFLIFYFSPTPGASGIAEISSAILMGQIIPQSFEGGFVIIWRFFSLYLGMTMGAAIMLRELLRNRFKAGDLRVNNS